VKLTKKSFAVLSSVYKRYGATCNKRRS